jgi:hypothetical protein
MLPERDAIRLVIERFPIPTPFLASFVSPLGLCWRLLPEDAIVNAQEAGDHNRRALGDTHGVGEHLFELVLGDGRAALEHPLLRPRGEKAEDAPPVLFVMMGYYVFGNHRPIVQHRINGVEAPTGSLAQPRGSRK